MRITAVLTTVSLLLASLGETKTITYDCQTTPQICLNGCWAVNCAKNIHPLNGGGYRTAREARIKSTEKRREWGYGSSPCKKGGRWAWTAPAITGGKRKTQYNRNRAAISPEEYPYASSRQGGLKWKGKTVALRCIPRLEQTIQGGKLSGIGKLRRSERITIKYNRIKHMPKGSPNWCSAKPTCKNDGNQFTATKKGNFVLAKSRRKRDLEDLELGNSTVVDDNFVGPIEDEDFDDEFDGVDTGPGLQVSPDGESAAISARWTEEGWVPADDDDVFDGEDDVVDLMEDSSDLLEDEQTETQGGGDDEVKVDKE